MPEYVELMKRCWDNDPEKRLTAEELKRFFGEWVVQYPMEKNKEKRIPVPGNYCNYDLFIFKLYLNYCYY